MVILLIILLYIVCGGICFYFVNENRNNPEFTEFLVSVVWPIILIVFIFVFFCKLGFKLAKKLDEKFDLTP